VLPGGAGVISRAALSCSFAATPVLSVTAAAASGDLQRVCEAGFDGFAGKPIN
jgi:CheY-like chemotaxis protein